MCNYFNIICKFAFKLFYLKNLFRISMCRRSSFSQCPWLIFPRSVAHFAQKLFACREQEAKLGNLKSGIKPWNPARQGNFFFFGIHPIPHHQFFSIVALCKCSTAAVNLSTCLVRLANDWRTMQRNIASCPEADCAANHFLQPTDSRGRLMSNNLILDIRSAHQEQFPPHIIDAYWNSAWYRYTHDRL